jgi:hypothetical protein
VGEISLRVVLYLDEQKMLDTPSYGDIDNHAKQLLDTIKGSGGLLIEIAKSSTSTFPGSTCPTERAS